MWAYNAWAQVSWAGGRPPLDIDAAIACWPDPERGVVELTVHWQQADYLTISRIGGNARAPVRGAC